MALTGDDLAAILGVIGVLGGAALAGYFALRSARVSAEAARITAKQAETAAGFTQSLEMTRYIRDQVRIGVAEDTADIRETVKQLERLVASLHGKYALVRDAFADFFRATFAKLGSDTPPIDGRIRELLNDDVEDTKTGLMMQQLRQSIASEDNDETPPYDGSK